MLRAINVTDWANDPFDKRAKLCKIVMRYLNRHDTAKRMQEMLDDELEHGECKVGHDCAMNYEGFRDRLDPFRVEIRARMQELAEGFVGRDWLADAIQRELARHNADDRDSFSTAANGSSALAKYKNPPAVVVYGDSGTGKSSFVCMLMDGHFCNQKKGSWQHLHSRILARHFCSVNSDESLSPVRWARSLAGQVILRAAEVGKASEVIAHGGHSDLKSLVDWIERQDSARHILTSCVIPLLEKLGPLDGRDTIWIDSLDEALTHDVLRAVTAQETQLWLCLSR